MKNDGTAYCFASERLRTDRELIMAALRSAAGIFEDHEEAFFDIVQNIPVGTLRAKPEVVEEICKLALAVDSEYYDEDSDPYEDSHERLSDTIKEYLEENGIKFEGP